MDPGHAAPRVARLLAIATFAIAVASCAGVPDYDQRGGPEIARQISAAKADWIENVRYMKGDSMDPSYITIKVRSGTTDQIKAFNCDVVRPIVERGDPPASLGIFYERGGTSVADYAQYDCGSTAGASPDGER